MDSQLNDLKGKLGASQYTSLVKASRAIPLSPQPSGLQVWVKDISSKAGLGDSLALLLVNIGNKTLPKYRLPVSRLPSYFKPTSELVSSDDRVRGQQSVKALS